jgi:hypothetical protein
MISKPQKTKGRRAEILSVPRNKNVKQQRIGVFAGSMGTRRWKMNKDGEGRKRNHCAN